MRSNKPTSGFTLIGTTATTSFTDSGKKLPYYFAGNGKTLRYYFVIAVDSHGNQSAPSSTVSGSLAGG